MKTFSRTEFFQATSTIAEPDHQWERETAYRWNSLCDRAATFGLLEKLHIRLAGWSSDGNVKVKPRALFIFAADNGIVEEGVAWEGQEATSRAVRAMAQGVAAVNTLGRVTDTAVVPVNVGVVELETTLEGVIHAPVMTSGTRNFAREDAMTEEAMMLAIRLGMEFAAQAVSTGFQLLIAGGLGVGNASSATTMLAALTGRSPGDLVGRDAESADETFFRKTHVLVNALAERAPDRYNAFDVLKKTGSLDIAAMVGFFAGAARAGIPVVLDGLAPLVAALTLVKLLPEARSIFIASQFPTEPGGELVLRELGLTPPIDAGLNLEEGSGALFLLPLLDLTCAFYDESPITEED